MTFNLYLMDDVIKFMNNQYFNEITLYVVFVFNLIIISIYSLYHVFQGVLCEKFISSFSLHLCHPVVWR